jgi:para-nitrobenzyl esterase
VEAIVNASGSGVAIVNGAINPLLDGRVLTREVKEAIESGKFNRVPIFNGTNHDEWRWFQALVELATGHVITADEYSAQLAAAFGANAPAVESAYRLGDFDSPSGALAAAQGDNVFICPARNMNLAASKYVPVYAFEFNDPNSPSNRPPVSFPLRAAHTHELQYLFPGWKGTFTGEVPPLTSGQQNLAKDMRRYWATFAKKGAPSSHWPNVTNRRELWGSLQVPKSVVINNFRRDHRCDLWNSLN